MPDAPYAAEVSNALPSAVLGTWEERGGVLRKGRPSKLFCAFWKFRGNGKLGGTRWIFSLPAPGVLCFDATQVE